MKERSCILSMSPGLSCVIQDNVNNIITFSCAIPLMSHIPHQQRCLCVERKEKEKYSTSSHFNMKFQTHLFPGDYSHTHNAACANNG